ncbi:MAG: glycosyltransferase family 2 protein [Clostridiales bacterium]|nr:glycosyltransferase family 2 protein [Clostridiales bacterium]
MDQPLLSVIIPVYNAQQVLPTALESVLSQAIPSMEIILINDGSKDDSLALCRQFALKDGRIKVLTQENAGPGAARNAGLKIARGHYIAFVDSDDTMQPDAFRQMLSAIRADESDMVIAHFNILINGQVLDRGYIKENTILGKEEFCHELAHRPGSYYYSALWNKLYARRIITENKLTFDNSYTWGEDFDFNMRYYKHVETVSFVNQPVYNYKRTYSGQTWRTMFELGSSLKIKTRLYQNLKSLYQHAGLYKKYKHYIYRYIFNVTIST